MRGIIGARIEKALSKVFSDRYSKVVVVRGIWYPEGSFFAFDHSYNWYRRPRQALAIFLVYREGEG